MRARLFLLLAALALVAAPGGQAEPRPHLILISLDTTRADALSSYGQVPDLLRDRGEVTPHLDRLAAEGLRFEAFWAHAPTTLNSHASMFTGRDPHSHGVPRNGYPLPPGIETLAERLERAGWDTLGVVGARALEAGMGIGRGFRIYDDRTSGKRAAMYQDRADRVVERAVTALDGRHRGRPLFLFVHFFDPHQPFDPPRVWRERFTDPAYEGPWKHGADDLVDLRHALRQGRARPEDLDQVNALYLGEIAFVDHQIGMLLEHLESEGILEHALVVVTADHGEVLSEHPPTAYSHGHDVTDGVMRVPLIVRGYGMAIGQRGVIRSQAEMAGLAPTLEEALGLEATLGDQASFFPLLRAGPLRDQDGWPERPTRPVVLEATQPHQDTAPPGWNNLGLWRGVRAGGWALQARPSAGEAAQVVGRSDPAVGALLSEQLRAWDAAAPPWREVEMSDETVEALRALGYLE